MKTGGYNPPGGLDKSLVVAAAAAAAATAPLPPPRLLSFAVSRAYFLETTPG